MIVKHNNIKYESKISPTDLYAYGCTKQLTITGSFHVTIGDVNKELVNIKTSISGRWLKLLNKQYLTDLDQKFVGKKTWTILLKNIVGRVSNSEKSEPMFRTSLLSNTWLK